MSSQIYKRDAYSSSGANATTPKSPRVRANKDDDVLVSLPLERPDLSKVHERQREEFYTLEWTRGKTFMTTAILLFTLIYFIHQNSRNSADGWYTSTYLTLEKARASDCLPTSTRTSVHSEKSDQYWSNTIRRLVQSNTDNDIDGRDSAEYMLELGVLLNCTHPCNVLVFGVSYDASLFLEANWNGKTIFLEDNQKWQQMVRRKVPCMNSYLVTYSTRLRDWPMYTERENQPLLHLNLPLEVLQTPWSVIVVQGPASEAARLGAWDNSGRMQSIFMAAQLVMQSAQLTNAKESIHVIVHDCDRMVEKKFADLLLNPLGSHQLIHRARHYEIPTAPISADTDLMSMRIGGFRQIGGTAGGVDGDAGGTGNEEKGNEEEGGESGEAEAVDGEEEEGD